MPDKGAGKRLPCSRRSRRMSIEKSLLDAFKRRLDLLRGIAWVERGGQCTRESVKFSDVSDVLDIPQYFAGRLGLQRIYRARCVLDAMVVWRAPGEVPGKFACGEEVRRLKRRHGGGHIFEQGGDRVLVLRKLRVY